MLLRSALTLLAWSAWLTANILLNGEATEVTGAAAARQFESSDSAALSLQVTMHWFSSLGLFLLLIVLAVLIALWQGPVRRGMLARRGLPMMVVLWAALVLGGMARPQPAYAFFDTSDKTEAYFILPNESAFWIPDVGANKDSQGRFEGVDYLNANKVAAKRFIIPHAKLSNSGGNWGFDAYVPTGRLIIVDRTPYNREWVAPKDRGTSARNESFPCQSSEGLNITVELSIATSVQEENAAKYLYWFGVKPPVGDRTDNRVIFTSVFYGRSLTEVMDGVGRGEVQTLVCNEFTSRTLDKANSDARAIMASVEKDAAAFFAARGITLDYLGWAGTFTYDPDVQAAINQAYAANKLAPVLETLKTKVALDVLEKWDGKLPTEISGFWLLPPDLMAAITAYLKPGDAAAKK